MSVGKVCSHLLLGGLLAAGAPAQTPAAQPPELRLWDVDDGLSQSSVEALLQDRQGFVWIGTEDGLNRFDGRGFKVFRPVHGDSESLSNGHVTSLFEETAGRIWIGTYGGGLNVYDPVTERFQRFPVGEDGLPNGYVQHVAGGANGGLWIATHEGVYRLDARRESFEPAFEGPDANRQAVLLVDGGTAWIGTGPRLYRGDAPSAFHLAAEMPGDSFQVTALFKSRTDGLWVGGADGSLFRLDATRLSTGRHLESRRLAGPREAPARERTIQAIFEDGEGALLAVNGREVLTFDREAERFEPFRRNNGEVLRFSSLVEAAIPDRADDVWLGTDDGLLHLNRHAKPFVHIQAGLSSPSVWAVLEDRRGTLWVGTDGDGLSHREAGAAEFTRRSVLPDAPASSGDDTVWALCEDRQGRLWIGTRRDGLLVLGPERRVQRRFRADADAPNSLIHDRIRVLLEDAGDTLWVGTAGGGLQRLHLPDGLLGPAEWTRYPVPHPLVTALLLDRSGILWVGTVAGLVTVDPQAAPAEAVVAVYRHDAANEAGGLSNDRIRDVHEDARGNLWIATHGGGLNRLDRATGNFTVYDRRDGLPNDVVYSILEDGGGDLWLSTNLGIARFDPRAETFTHYDAGDGLQSNEFNLNADARGPSGTFYFGGINGVSAFRPEEIVANPQVPPVVLTDFRLVNDSVAVGPLADGRTILERSIGRTDAIVLEHHDRVFSFAFTALSYVRPERTRYAYKMEHFDETWRDAGDRREAFYTNLAPGEYVFRVKAATSDGVWNEDGAAVRVHIRPAFYQRRSVQVAALLAAVLAIVTAVRLRLHDAERRTALLVAVNEKLHREIEEREQAERELKNTNAELEQFNYTVSHDLKNPLLTIKAFLGYVDQDVRAGRNERAVEDLARIRDAADKMESLLAELLKLSRAGRIENPPEAVSMDAVVAQAVELTAGRLGAIELVIADDLGTVYGDRLRMRTLLENLISNATQFMGEQPAPRIEIGVRQDGGERVFYVCDNGIGIAPEYHEKVFNIFDKLDAESSGTGVGLALVKRIVDVAGGRVWVESDGVGQGACFCFTLPAAPQPTA